MTFLLCFNNDSIIHLFPLFVNVLFVTFSLGIGYNLNDLPKIVIIGTI